MSLFKGTEYADTLWAIHVQCFDHPWSFQNFQELLKLPNTFGFCQNEGFILCAILPEDIEILTFAILPDYRRQGIGTALLKSVQDFAVERQKKHIFLEVKATNQPAYSLYIKNGFIQTGIRKNYYHEKDKTVDAHCLTWKNPRCTTEDLK